VIRAPRWAALHAEEPALVYRWDSASPAVATLTKVEEATLEEARSYQDRVRGSLGREVPMEESLRRRLDALGYVDIKSNSDR
jgi:hypothetical protein